MMAKNNFFTHILKRLSWKIDNNKVIMTKERGISNKRDSFRDQINTWGTNLESYKEIGGIIRIGAINPYLLERFKENGLSIPSLLDLKDLISFLFVACLIVLPLISPTLEYYIFIYLVFASLISTIGLIYRGVMHILHYNRWLKIFGDEYIKQLELYKINDPQKYINIINYISTGRTRDFLKRYPEEYIVLGVPHLWNSLIGTKISVYISILILLTIIFGIIKFF